MTCTEALQRYQDEAWLHDESAWQEERAKYVKELEAELKDLSEANSGSGRSGVKCFLLHLYKTHPPKNPQHKLNDEDLDKRANIKQALKKALQHFHPDKQDKEQHGKKWTVLCEEITKLLNGRYDSFKFPPDEQME